MNNIILNKKENNLNPLKNTIYNIMNNDIELININIKDDLNIIINDFRIINKSRTKINIILNDKSSLIYNHSYLNKNTYNLNINTKYNGHYSNLTLNIHGINDNGISNIIIDGDMGENFNNTLLENIRGVNINKGKGKIEPNILVNNSQIDANHKATIGALSNDELNYLMSKGISKEESKRLILIGFLTNIFEDLTFITRIKELIYWRKYE